MAKAKVWGPSNVYPTAVLGDDVSIGAFCEIGDGVTIGSGTRVGAMSFIPAGVTIEEDCFIGPRATFTNDRYPPSPKSEWEKTVVKKGAKLGAAVTVLCGIQIGENAVIGAGSVVTHSVPAGEVWCGVPARKTTAKLPIRDMSRLNAFIEQRAKDVEHVTADKFRESVKKITDAGLEEVSALMSPGAKVLDVGFGCGYTLDAFERLGCEVCGITMCQAEVDEQQEKHDVRLMDMSFMSFDDKSFDLVWARHCLEHSLFPFFTLHELYRVMRPGAVLYMEVPAPRTKVPHENYANHYSVLDKLMWVSLLRRTGFKDIQAVVLVISTGKGVLTEFYKFIARRHV